MEKVPNVEFQVFYRDPEGKFLSEARESLSCEYQIEEFEYGLEPEPITAEEREVIKQLKQLLPPAVKLRLDNRNSPLLIIRTAVPSAGIGTNCKCICKCGVTATCGGGGGGGGAPSNIAS